MLFWTNLLLYLAYLYQREGKIRHLFLAFVVITAAILTKVNGWFLTPLIPLIYCITSLRQGKFRGGELLKTVIFSALLPAAVLLFYLWRMDLLHNFLHELTLRGRVDDSGIRFDHNIKIFLISSLIAFQLYIFLIWSRRRKEALPPALLIAVTVVLLLLGSAPLFLRFYLPLVPSLLLLSSAKLEKIRTRNLPLFNLLILWTIAFNYLVMLLHLYY